MDNHKQNEAPEEYEDFPVKYMEIPEIFHAYESKEPFQHCIGCQKNLVTENEHYMIEKVCKRHEGYDAETIIFEFAMCMNCVTNMRAKMSEESLERMDDYFTSQIDFSERSELLSQAQNPKVEDLIGSCILTGEAMKDTDEYHLIALCHGDKMTVSQLPYMIGASAMEALSNLVSEKTRDEMDGFIDNHFGLPPDLKKVIKEKKLVLA